MTTSVPHFVSLRPDPHLYARIEKWKSLARALVGPQLYLDDPPHMTLYSACFPPQTDWEDLCHRLAQFPAPRFRLAGWKQWIGDVLTARNTLVCAINETDKIVLRDLQHRVVSILAPLRDPEHTSARRLSKSAAIPGPLKRNIEEHGFPFLGDGWEPHFTVASFEPAVWERLLEGFKDESPDGAYSGSEIEIFELDGLTPVLKAARHLGA